MGVFRWEEFVGDEKRVYNWISGATLSALFLQ